MAKAKVVFKLDETDQITIHELSLMVLKLGLKR